MLSKNSHENKCWMITKIKPLRCIKLKIWVGRAYFDITMWISWMTKPLHSHEIGEDWRTCRVSFFPLKILHHLPSLCVFHVRCQVLRVACSHQAQIKSVLGMLLSPSVSQLSYSRCNSLIIEIWYCQIPFNFHSCTSCRRCSNNCDSHSDHKMYSEVKSTM